MNLRRLVIAAVVLAVAAFRGLLAWYAYFGPDAVHSQRLGQPVLSFAVLVWVPFLSLAAGALIGLWRPGDRQALLAAAMFLAFANVFVPDLATLPGWFGGPALLVGSLASALLLPWAVLLLFTRYPARSPLDVRAPWLKWVLPLGSALLLLVAQPGSASHRVLFVWISIFYGAAMTALGMSIGRAKSPDERRRLLLLMWGACFGTAPLFVLALSQRLGWKLPAPVSALLVLTLGLFPLTFVYVVLRHRVFGARLLVRRGLQWAFVSRGILVLEGVAVYYFLTAVLGSALTTETSAALAVGLVFALRGVNNRLQPAIDRRFFREAYDARQVLTELSVAVRTLAADPVALVERVTQTVMAALHPRSLAVFLGEGLWPGPQATSDGPPLAVGVAGVPCRPARVAGDTPLAPGDTGPHGALAGLTASIDPAKPQALQASDGRLIVPLVAGGRSLGLLLLGVKLSEEPWSREDRELLLTVADQTAVAIENAGLFRRLAQQQKLEREVEIAREVQEQLWPRLLPASATLRYHGSCEPARGVGGDYYDFLPLGGGRLAITLGDISGKGISAALLMSSLHATLKSHAPSKGGDPAALLAEVNRLLYEATSSSRYATLFYGVYDEARRTLLYATAGHIPPILLRADAAIERLDKGGMVVGLFPEASFENGLTTLRPDDLLLIFSDGVSEAESASGEMFGEERVAELAKRHAGLDPKALHDLLLAEVADFTAGMPPHDDTTLIVARAT